MKIAANRLIVFAASALALGSVAFGQTGMENASLTAKIPFAFRTVSGTMPAGTYRIASVSLNGLQHVIYLQNTEDWKSISAGIPTFDPYKPAPEHRATMDFACRADVCTLRAIRTSAGSLLYAAPHPSRAKEKDAPVALISIPLQPSNGE
jgi:hypothetical protein